MTSIPGLSFCPAEENGLNVEISSFGGKIAIPDSHWRGHCRTLNEFEKLNTISKRSSEIVYKCRKKGTNEYYILKVPSIPPESGIPSSVLREITILSTLRHDNIVSFYGVVAGKINNNYLILGYCPVSLNDLIQKEAEGIYACDVVKNIMKQLFCGLAYIHEALIIHRDIKEENVLFTCEGVLKITGFNTSRYYSKGDMTPNVSDLAYRAPELLYQAKTYTSAVDMWSAGCLFAKLLLKKSLFYGRSELEVLRTIFDVLGTPSEAVWPGFAELFAVMTESHKVVADARPYSNIKDEFGNQPLSCQDLIKDLLVYYPEARISAKECMKSTYITELPSACKPQRLSSILKTVLPPESPLKKEKMDPDFSLQ